VTACDFAVGHLKAHPECSNKDIQEAAAVAGIKAYPNAISEARKKAGLPAARGRKPGVKNKVFAKAEKSPKAPYVAIVSRETVKIEPAVDITKKEYDVLQGAAKEVGGLWRLQEICHSATYFCDAFKN
jgi:hypothetical protein